VRDKCEVAFGGSKVTPFSQERMRATLKTTVPMQKHPITKRYSSGHRIADLLLCLNSSFSTQVLSRWGVFAMLLVVLHTRCEAAGLSRIAATPGEILFVWDEPHQEEVCIREHPIGGLSQNNGRVVWTGRGSEGRASVGRFSEGTDRLFSGYTIAVKSAHEAPEPPKYVTDLERLARRNAFPRTSASKKGIACLLDAADGRGLGVAWVNQNIDIAGLLDFESVSPKKSFEYEGRRIGLRTGAVDSLDKTLGEAARAGQRVTGILLNNVTKRTPRDSPLVHPLTDPQSVPLGPSAFNTATSEGVFYFRAIVSWLVDRYTREDAAFGRLDGLVIGNEMQSHWSWYHLGLAEPDTVIKEYCNALRIADLATRSLHADFPIYVSLDHHWCASASEDPGKGFSAVEALEGIHTISKSGGDFPWNVAFHPYPENLLDPRFWRDRAAPLRFDAPKVTFQNLEVLPAFLKQERFLYNGRVRRIALTEQGFHCQKGKDGEEMQAAAYALAWKKVVALPEIESFLYHRHVDHPHEFGLYCGIREHDGSSNVLGIGRKRKFWEVMQAAGTPGEENAFAFALPVIGRSDWLNIVSTHFDPPRPPQKEQRKVAYDFVLHLKDARAENLQAVEKRKVGMPDEVGEAAILEHPKATGRGSLFFNVEIPPVDAATQAHPVLKFDALLNHSKSSGAGFHVTVDGIEVFSMLLRGGGRESASVDLSPWSGSSVVVALVVDAAGDPAYDWATWVSPAVVFQSFGTGL
jgi:hypothetical protein